MDNRDRRGSKNSNWRGGPKKHICNFCKTEFYNYKPNSKFCSKSCYAKSQIGKPAWNKGLTKETDARVAAYAKGFEGKNNPMYGKTPKPLSPEGLERLRQSKLGKNNPNWKPKVKKTCVECDIVFYVIPSGIGRKYCSKECGYKSLSSRMTKNNPMKNPEVVKKAVSTNRKNGNYDNGGAIGKLWSTKYDEMYSIVGDRMKNNNPMKNEESIIKMMKSRDNMKLPTKFEKHFIEFLIQNDLPFNYVGAGNFFITCKGIPDKIVRNPDFIYKDITEKKILIEIGNIYHHPEDNVALMIKQYSMKGWLCLWFYDTMIYEDPNKVKEIILNALG